MLRTIVDHAVFSPERIIFESQPELQNGLIKKYQKAMIFEGSFDFLDLSKCKSLSTEEEVNFQLITNESKNENSNTQYMIESKKEFLQYRKHFYKKLLAESGSESLRIEFNGLSIDEIAEKEYFLSKNKTLLFDHKIYLENGETTTVQEILNNPAQFHEQSCYEPNEKNYGNGDIAKIYSNQDIPVIHSFAHGDIIYYLKINPEKLTEKPNFWSKEY